jgi:hypothetical protein
MSWYTNSATSAWQQLNASGTTYTVVYIAWGKNYDNN